MAAREAPGDLGFKVLSEGLSAEIDILQRSPIQVQTEADVAYPHCTRQLAVAVCQ